MLRFQSLAGLPISSSDTTPGVAGHVLEAVEGGDDLLDVLGTQVVLRAAGVELGVGIDEEHLAAAVCGLVRVRRLAGEVRTHHQDAGRDAGAVEQVRRQADDGLDEVLFEELLADLLLRPAAKEHAVGHDGGDHAAGLADGQHVLGEHQVALLARGRTPAPAEALGELHVAARIVLAERRIGDDAVEALQLARLAVHGVQQRILELDVGAGHAMQEHVQLADGPGRGIVHLAAQAQVGRITAGLLDELAADDEHTAGAAGGVIDAQARPRLEDADHEPDDIARGVEVAALLARRLGEHVDQELVGRAEQVGELKILIAQAVAVEVAHQVLARVIGDDALIA